MKISAVRPLVLGPPWRDLTFVVVETDEGSRGVGEARMVVAQAVAPLGIPVATGERLHTPHEYRELFELQAAAKKLAAWADARVKAAVTGMVEIDPADGCFPLSIGSGLGVTLNEDFVAEHPPEDAFFDLFAERWHQCQAAAKSTTRTDEVDPAPSQGMEAHHD